MRRGPSPAAPTGLLAPVAAQVETTLFRSLAVLRVVVACYAVALNAGRWREFEHRAAGWLVVGVIVAWTLVASWAYDAPRRRGLPLLGADLLVTVGTLLATPYVQSEGMLARHASTLPTFWVIGAVLAWAVSRGWRGGLAVAVVVSGLDVTLRALSSGEINGTTWGNVFLMLLAAGVVGYSTQLIRDASEARAEAERIAAALGERARLARAVHDGVLQVLALVQRRGAELGGDGAELARLAGEQEVALRALVQGVDPTPSLGSDLVSALGTLASSSVTVSGPAHPVLLPPEVVRELRSVVAACLDNVTRHVGEHAPAWVLVEELGERTVVTVRDEGPGIAPERLRQARAEGRLGVSESICGRMTDLGGRAELVTGPGRGTEWELEVTTPPR